MMVASQALQDMGNHALDSNDGAIEADVREGVETLMDQHRDDMRIIFSGGPAAVRELMHAAQDILSDIAAKNHGTGAEIITSTGRTMISTFSAASTITTMGIATATSIALGYDKADGAVDEFTSRFGEAIHQIASQTNTLETISNEELDERLESFTENLISFVFTQIKGVWKADVVGPLASFGGSLLGMGFMEFLDKTAQKLFGPKVKELEHKAQKIIIEQVKDTSEFVAVGGGSGSGSGGANDNNKPTEHTVQQGETLSSIAKKHGTTVEELKKLNPKITDLNKIFIGQKINLPGGDKTPTHTKSKSTNDNSYKPVQNKFSATTKDSSYLASKSLANAYNIDHAEIDKKIDALDASSADKVKFKQEIHEFLKNLREASPYRRSEMVDALQKETQPKETGVLAGFKGIFNGISHAIIPEAEAVVPVLVAAGTCLSNPACSALLVGTTIVAYNAMIHTIDYLSHSDNSHKDNFNGYERSKIGGSSGSNVKVSGSDMGTPDPDFDPDDHNKRNAIQKKLNDVVDHLKKEYDWEVPQEALDKVPEHLRDKVKTSQNDKGIRWGNGENQIRFGKAHDNPKFDTQKVDYVKISRNGQSLDSNGNSIISKAPKDKTSHYPEAHIPLKDWLKWKEWNKP